MTQTEHLPAAPAPPSTGEAAEWIRRNAITLAAVALIVVQLWWKAGLLSHFYFRQDDFQILDHALASRFSGTYLITIDGGHLMPGGLALAWVLARVSLYDWTLASLIILAMLAAASLALLRLLRTLFGSRPAILIPLTVYLFTPLTVPGLSFWATTLNWLPLQLAILMAADAHIRYVRTGRFRHAAVAAAWLVFGMLFGEPGLLVLPLLFALTSAFLVSGSWPRAAAATLRRFWRGWLLYGVLAAAYLAVFLIQLETSSQQPAKPGLFAGVLAFTSILLRVSFIPGALGGPWHWYSAGNYGFALEVPVLTQLSWAVAAAIVIVSLWFRRHAWRAWAILAGWLLIADMLPVILSRVSVLSPAFLGMDLHYLADSAPVLAICLGLAYWPVAGEQDAYRAQWPARFSLPAVIGALVACFLAGSFWSGSAYLADTSSKPVSSYIATARAAVRQVPAGSVIVSTPVPAIVMSPVLFGQAADTSQVIGPLAPSAARLGWTQSPAGLITNLMIFDNEGRLWPAADIGVASTRPPGKRGCWPLTALTARIPIGTNLYNWIWTIQLWYSGPAATLQVQFGQALHDVNLPAGTHDVYIPATGSGDAVLVSSTSPGPAACVSRLTVGTLQPVPGAVPVPFAPVS